MTPLEQDLTQFYSVQVVPDTTTEGAACYLASYEELPYCLAHGVTPEEAQANLLDARDEYVAAMKEQGLPLPAPKNSILGAPAPRAILWASRAVVASTATVGVPPAHWEKVGT